ncbi:DUF1697 domain-containing protein [Microbacterium sp. KUDC0406]|uniref:DUF1697 domain-containing protein n=1 Tax=Microbacterium sp. KUDC0406 TaxID=2909588 RepID=UPI001F17A9F1|nr:DUF1697 domain-containing protein [Microbacterium sp. KUDC0406]UJP10398.1 DUF1697 domain-containing protein [Microbacterium sp. KUDC0406]
MTSRCALLLRAVNVGGRNRVPMAELRSLLADRLGLQNVKTYIASGNVLCDLPADREAVRALIAAEFEVDTPVVQRSHDELVAALAGNPFPDAAADRMLHAMFLDGSAAPGAVDALTPRLQPWERMALVGQELWIDYGAGGVQSTRLTPAALDRALGVAGTARNLRTVRTLADLTA